MVKVRWGRVAQTLEYRVTKATAAEAAEASRVAMALCCGAAQGLLTLPELWLTKKLLNHRVGGCRMAKRTEIDRSGWNVRIRQSLILLKPEAGEGDQTQNTLDWGGSLTDNWLHLVSNGNKDCWNCLH